MTAPTAVPPVIPADEVNERSPLWCSLHLGLLQDPVMNSGCGHTYCRSCVEAWRAKQESCPICRTPLATLLPNLTAKHLLDTLVIHCRYGVSQQADGEWKVDPSGCPEVIECQRRNKHENSCPFAAVPCPNDPEGCGTVARKDLEKHREVCPFGLISRPEDIIKLNVGGRLFTTTRQTLCKYPSKLKTLVEDAKRYAALPKDEHGAVFIDKNGSDFAKVLEFLRSDSACMETVSGDMKELLQSFAFLPCRFTVPQNLQQESTVLSFNNIQNHKNVLPRTDGVYLGSIGISIGSCRNYSYEMLVFFISNKSMELFFAESNIEYFLTRPESNEFISSGPCKFSMGPHGIISVHDISIEDERRSEFFVSLTKKIRSLTMLHESCIVCGSSLLLFHPFRDPTGTSYSGDIRKNYYNVDKVKQTLSFAATNWSKDSSTGELMFKTESGETYSGYCCDHFLLLRKQLQQSIYNGKVQFSHNAVYLLKPVIPPRQ